MKKNFVAVFEKKDVIENWDELEVFVGKPCNTLYELLARLNSKLRTIFENKKSKDSLELKEKNKSLQSELSEERENNKLLQIELGTVQTLKSELAEKQEKINQLEKQSEHDVQKIGNLENSLEQKGRQINITLKHLIDVQNYIDSAEDNKHLTKEIVLQAVMKQTEVTLRQLGVVIMNQVGEPFDSKFQAVVIVQDTNNPNENNIVCESLSRGYRKDDYCIKEQEVIIYQYKN